MPKSKKTVSRSSLLAPTGSNKPLDGVRTATTGRAKKSSGYGKPFSVHKRQTGGCKGMDSPMGRMDKKTGSRPGSAPKFPVDSGRGVKGNRGPIKSAPARGSASGVPKRGAVSLPKQKGRGVKGAGNKAVGKKSGRGKSLKARAGRA